jgi:hypothetical protein
MDVFQRKQLITISLLAGMLLHIVPRCCAQNGSLQPSPNAPDAAGIVRAIEQHDQSQTKALESYHAIRHYEIVYRNLFKNVTARMDVELQYDASSGKNFRIISQSGSHALCEKVFNRAMDSEKEAFKDHGAHALSHDNYTFQLLGSEMRNGRLSYVLQVNPISTSPYLFRGRIWVDAADYAVSGMEVQPAKNPSFWISQTLIHQTNTQIDGFWLPQQVQSETKVRIGGKAVMTISYGPYQLYGRKAP